MMRMLMRKGSPSNGRGRISAWLQGGGEEDIENDDETRTGYILYIRIRASVM